MRFPVELTLAVAIVASPAFAECGFMSDAPSYAISLAGLFEAAERCKLQIDPAKLQSYVAKNIDECAWPLLGETALARLSPMSCVHAQLQATSMGVLK